MRLDISQVTPEMAQAELNRRNQSSSMQQITPEMAQQELSRRGVNIQDSQSIPQDHHGFMDYLKVAGAGMLGHLSGLTQTLTQPIMDLGPKNMSEQWRQMFPTAEQFQEQMGLKDVGKEVGDPRYALQKTIEYAPLASGLAGGILGLGKLAKGAIEHGPEILSKLLPKSINPESQAKNAINILSEGKTLNQNRRDLVQDLRNSYKNVKNESKNLYSTTTGNEDLKSKEIFPENYLSLDKDISSGFTSSLKNREKDLLSNPTFENAHKFQSKLGEVIRSSQKKPLGIDDQERIENFINAKDSLNKDISNFLRKTNPKLAKDYELATQHYASDVVPYKENPSIYNLVKSKSKINSVNNISNLFSKDTEGIETIANHLGPKGINKILYDALGLNPETVTSKSLLDKASSLDKRNLSPFVSDELKKYLDNISRAKLMRNAGLSAAGALGAYHYAPGLISHLFGGGK